MAVEFDNGITTYELSETLDHSTVVVIASITEWDSDIWSALMKDKDIKTLIVCEPSSEYVNANA